MRTPSVFVSSAVVLAATSSLATAGFTGFTADRVVLSNGNIQYKVYANFNDVGQRPRPTSPPATCQLRRQR